MVAESQEGDPDGWLARRWGVGGRPQRGYPAFLPSTQAVLAQRRASSRPTSRSARTAPPPASSAAGAARPAACSAAAAGASWGSGAGERELARRSCGLPPRLTGWYCLSSRDVSEEHSLLVN